MIIELGVITIIAPRVITIIAPEVFINKFNENLARRQILKLFKHKEKDSKRIKTAKSTCKIKINLRI